MMPVRLSPILLLAALVMGCAPGINHSVIESAMSAGNCPEATRKMESMKGKYGKNQALLFEMDAGMVELYCSEHRKSRAHLTEAERIAEELWTRSLSKEGASFLLNDYTIPYSGEDFEKVMVNLFAAISYAVEGQLEPSLVEVRKVNNLLTEINARYEKKSVYREDAFARYMSASLYEAEAPGSMESLDSAAIDMRRGLEVYEAYEKEYGTPVPGIFMEDYGRIMEATGRKGDVRNPLKWPKQKEVRKLGRIVMVHLSGRVPHKEEDAVVGMAPHGPIKVAFPKYGQPLKGCRQSTLIARSGGEVFKGASELVEDVSAIAIKNLDDRKGRVVAKTIARAIAKQAVVEAAAREADNARDKALARIAGRIVAAATERADLRSWRNLPDRIYMARMFVPEGTYDISAEYCGMEGALGSNITIKAGQSRFVLLQSVY